MLKRYRCPYCGEEKVTPGQKAFYYYNGRGRLYRMKQGNLCSECTQYFISIPRYQYGKYIDVFVFAVPFLFFVYLTFFVSLYYIALLMVYFLVSLFVLAPIYNLLFCALSQFDQETQKPVKLDPNAQIEIREQSGRIENLDILGVKFSEKTRVARFFEAFTNQLVPVVFYKENRKQKSPLRATFMKSEFIPPALLREGAEFTVIDNGKRVATGVIVKLFQSDRTERM